MKNSNKKKELSARDYLIVKKSNNLSGEIQVSGSKNSCLALLGASGVIDSKVSFSNVPDISDVIFMQKIMEHSGVRIEKFKGGIKIDSSNIKNSELHSYSSKLRGSIFSIVPVLYRTGKVSFLMPGGCNIGKRPIDMHIDLLEKMGVESELSNDYLHLSAKNGIKGADINFKVRSVGATINAIIAGSVAKTKTTIKNAALEPEVIYVADFLNSAGAKIKGHGTSEIEIEPFSSLKIDKYNIPPDRIEFGTYLIAVAAIGGNVTIKNAIPKESTSIISKIKQMGVEIQDLGNGVMVIKSSGKLQPVDIETKEYPDFPTDLQSPMTAALCIANGKSIITENLFESRFNHVEELVKMGAKIDFIEGNKIIIEGVGNLKGANVKATDLRAGKAMIIAGALSEGETIVQNKSIICRGYENIVEKLSHLGLNIE